MGPAEFTVFLELQFVGSSSSYSSWWCSSHRLHSLHAKVTMSLMYILLRRFTSRHQTPSSEDQNRRSSYSIISETTPAPTVLPPSRIAKRSSFSRAMGVISCASRATLSPGITISTPFGKRDNTGHVGCSEIELRPVSVKKRCMTTTFFFVQDIRLGLELRVGGNRARVAPLPGHSPPLLA